MPRIAFFQGWVYMTRHQPIPTRPKSERDVTYSRATACLLVFSLGVTPAVAQQSVSATRAAAAQAATGSAQSSRRPMFLTGLLLASAGGVAIIAGSTVARTSDATSGNTPKGTYDSCVALRSNPVYSGNDCDVLKGPNKALVIGGALAAAAGITLSVLGAPNSSITVGPGTVAVRQRIVF